MTGELKDFSPRWKIFAEILQFVITRIIPVITRGAQTDFSAGKGIRAGYAPALIYV
jgi:hypothetical protein